MAVSGCITNIDYLRSLANSAMFEQAKIATKVFELYACNPSAFEVVVSGTCTTVQNFSNRKGLWHVGVPPSGCMDEYASRIANSRVGNHKKSPALEITFSRPTLFLYHDVIVGQVPVEVDGVAVKQWTPIHIKKGEKLATGKLKNGCRAYSATSGCSEVCEYLGFRF